MAFAFMLQTGISTNKLHENMNNNKTSDILKTWNGFMDFHRDRFGYMRAKGLVSCDTLEFPIYWDRSVPVLEHLFYTYRYYLAEIKEFVKEKKCCDNIDDEKIKSITSICNSILKAYHEASQWKTDSAVNVLVKNKNIESLMFKCIQKIPQGTYLYRLRGDKDNLCSKNDFMHVPFDKVYLCNSMRFSLPGEPCLYLGYSEKVCRIELDNQKGGSIGHFKTLKDINIIDLTLNKLQNSVPNLFELWPILAACYVTPPDRVGGYKEEYVFSQIIMRYIKDTFFENKDEKKDRKCYGIRYYTCRDAELDPTSEEYLNVALFADTSKTSDVSFDINEVYPLNVGSKYDPSLCEILKFIP